MGIQPEDREPFEETDDVLPLASGTHLQHVTMLQITQDGVVTAALALSKNTPLRRS